MRKLIAALLCLGMVALAACSDENGSGSGEASDIPVQGILVQTVKVVLTAKLEPCGASEEAANANVMNDESRDALDAYIGFFNDEVLADAGWTLEYEIVDDGGADCPEKARAAGRRIVEEIQPFAVIGPSQSLDQGPVLADMVSAAGIRHIGLSWNVASEIEARSPYVWPITQLAERSMTNLVGYIDKRVKGTPGHDPATREEVDERHYGMATVDLPEFRELATIVEGQLADIGIELEQTYFLDADAAVAGQNAGTVVNRMAADGINTLIFEFFSSAAFSGGALTQTMAQQNFRPDILTGSYGLAAIFAPLHEPTVWANNQGTSSFSPLALRAAILSTPEGGIEFDPQYADIAENATPTEDTWEHLGNELATLQAAVPAANNYFLGMSLVAIGLLHNTDDDEVTARSWAEGIWSTAVGEENRCTLGRFIGGRDTEYHPNYSWAEGDYDGPIDEFTTAYFVTEEPFPGLPGYFESFDNYTYYTEPADLPDEATHDTGETPPDIPLQEEVGLHPWTTCEEVGLT